MIPIQLQLPEIRIKALPSRAARIILGGFGCLLLLVSSVLPTVRDGANRNDASGSVASRVRLASPVGDDVEITVTVSQPPPPGETYWLMVRFKGGPHTVYKALAQVGRTRSVSHSLASSATGSTRTYYVVAAGAATARELQANLDHPEPSWDGKRTLAPDADIISNLLPVTKP
jgi:hypothetical protein